MTRRLLLPALLLAGAAASAAADEPVVQLVSAELEGMKIMAVPEYQDGVSVLRAKQMTVGQDLVWVPESAYLLDQIRLLEMRTPAPNWKQNALTAAARAIHQSRGRRRCMLITPFHTSIMMQPLRAEEYLRAISHLPDAQGRYQARAVLITRELIAEMERHFAGLEHPFAAARMGDEKISRQIAYEHLRSHVDKALRQSAPAAVAAPPSPALNFNDASLLGFMGHLQAVRLESDLAPRLEKAYEKLGLERPTDDDIAAGRSEEAGELQMNLLRLYMERFMAALRFLQETMKISPDDPGDDSLLVGADHAVRRYLICFLRQAGWSLKVNAPPQLGENNAAAVEAFARVLDELLKDSLRSPRYADLTATEKPR